MLIHLPPRYASDRVPEVPTDVTSNAAEGTANGKARADVEGEIRRLGTQVITGIAAATAGVLAYGRLQLSRQEHRRENTAHITNRYTAAVAQLDEAEKPDVALGGIYALERIGIDSDADRSTIVQVLAAYLRLHRTRLNFDPSAERRPPFTSLGVSTQPA